jgi:hypothetical protein
MLSELEHPGDLRHGLSPIWAATRVANPDYATLAPVTFHGGAVFAVAAPAWRDAIFTPALLPAIRATLNHARRGEVREIAALDQKLSQQLPASALAGSLRAGQRLAAHGCDLRGDRLLPRLGEWVRDGVTPGNLAIIFAARCAAFSQPDRVAVGAYLFQEMCAGAPLAAVPAVCDFVAACIEPLGGSSTELRAA